MTYKQALHLTARILTELQLSYDDNPSGYEIERLVAYIAKLPYGRMKPFLDYLNNKRPDFPLFTKCQGKVTQYSSVMGCGIHHCAWYVDDDETLFWVEFDTTEGNMHPISEYGITWSLDREDLE